MYRLPSHLISGSSPALRCQEVLLPGLSAPVSCLEGADPDELLQRAIDGDEDEYCAQIWPSAFAAARALVRHLSVRPGSVTELGCGPGLPSLAALAAGAPSVTATDWSPLALALTRHAADTFQPERAARLATVRLDVFGSRVSPFGWPCDYLVAADMLYDAATAEAVGRCAAQQSRLGTTTVIADPGRPGGRAAFLRGVASARGPDFAHSLHFKAEGLPQRWCGASQSAAIGICELPPV